MSSNSTLRINNEQMLLINILNTMYNDNLRQIENLNVTLNNLNLSNTQIRQSLVQILNNPHNNSRRNASNERNNRENFQRNNNSNRFLRPYIFDTFIEYSVPRRTTQESSTLNSNEFYNDIFNSFLQPINIYPTQSQIESATRRVRYCDITRPINTQCPISMDDFNDNDMVTVIRQCGHIFQTDHLMNWFRTNCRCPVCRYDIRDYNSNAFTEMYDSSNNNLNSSTLNSSVNNNLNGTSLQTQNQLNENSRNNINNFSNSLSSLFNDVYIGNMAGINDLSGNQIDSLLGATTALANILNSMNNRTRNS